MKFALFLPHKDAYGHLYHVRCGRWSKNIGRLKNRAQEFGRGAEVRNMQNVAELVVC